MKLVGHSNKQRRQNNEKSAECHTVRVRATLPRVKQNGTDYLAQKKRVPERHLRYILHLKQILENDEYEKKCQYSIQRSTLPPAYTKIQQQKS